MFKNAIEDLGFAPDICTFSEKLVKCIIIEERSITELICQKATILPQGVWILTDLNNEVINAIDTQVEESEKKWGR